jgi:single-strand DNA-binding protein
VNKVVLIGRLTKDPELRYAAGSGNAVSRFSVAVTRQFKKEETDFINCVAFGKTAETISQYLVKGSQIALTGSIRTGSYDAQDGSKRYTTDVSVDSFEFIGTKGAQTKSNRSTKQDFNEEYDRGFNDDGLTPVEGGDMPF